MSIKLHSHFRIETIGAVGFSVNPRCRTMRLKVDADGNVMVSVPPSVSMQRAEDFVRSKTDWIIKQQQKVRANLTLFGPDTVFRTKFHELKIVPSSRTEVSAMAGDGIIQVCIPHQFDFRSAGFQRYIRRVLVEVMRREALAYLPSRLAELSEACRLPYKNVRVKSAKSRWGSCSSQNNINLNVHLMRLHDRLIDYVLLHELAHVTEKNHSPRFWSLLEKICPGARQLDMELKQHRLW